MNIWADPEFQYRVRQLLIYSAEFIETDAECYRESNAVNGELQGMERQVYESEMGMVAEIDRVLAEIEAQRKNAVGGTDAVSTD